MSALLCGFPAIAAAQPATLLRSIDDPNPGDFGPSLFADAFGTSVNLVGDRLFVGAPGDDTLGVNVGQVHVFDASTGTLLRTLDDPTPSSVDLDGLELDFPEGDRFGFSLAATADLVLVGAPGDNTAGLEVGQAHLFDAATGQLLFTLDDPSPTPDPLRFGDFEAFRDGDQFGFSVALSDDYAVVGAPDDSSNAATAGLFVGQVHVFDPQTGTLLRTIDDPTSSLPQANDRFGSALAMDGNLLLVGAERDRSSSNPGPGPFAGQAHLFDLTSGDLLLTLNDPAPGFFGGQFGSSVSISEDRVVIGRQETDFAHLFDATSGDLIQSFELTPDPFGTSGGNAFVENGLVFVPSFSLRGEVRVYRAADGSLLGAIENETVGLGLSHFGAAIDLDGGLLAIGAPLDSPGGPRNGRVYLFEIVIPEPSGVALLAVAAAFSAPSRGPLRRRR